MQIYMDLNSLPCFFVALCSYRNGIRGHMKAIIQEMLRHYLDVEKRFQHGPYDKCIFALRDEFKGDMATVFKIIYSHFQVQNKNKLVVGLIVSASVTWDPPTKSWYQSQLIYDWYQSQLCT